MFLIFLFILFLTLPLSVSPIYADDFDIEGDTYYNQYWQATSLAILDTPDIVQDSPGISYDPEMVVGADTPSIFEYMQVGDLTDMNYWRRIPGIADMVSGPPGTEIDIIYHFLNKTGHEINVSKVVKPFSRGDMTLGNWLNIVSVDPILPYQREISVLWDQRILKKSGLLKEYFGPGILENTMSGAYILDTLEVLNPILVTGKNVENTEQGVNIEIELQNIGTETLQDILFEHYEYSTNLEIQSMHEVKVEYTLENLEDLGHFRITNPNWQTECVVYGNPKYNWVLTDAVTVLAFREDGGWVNGPFISPVQESFCISRTPYTMTSSHLGYSKPVEDGNMEEGIETEICQEENSLEVLGVEDEESNYEETEEVKDEDFVLPKTGVVIL